MADEVIQVSPEEQELLDLWRQYERYPKLSQWLRLYFDKNNELGQATYLDGTKCAFIAYSIDPQNEHYAWEIASKNATKCKVWVQRYLAAKGWTKEKTLDLILTHSIYGQPGALKILASLQEIYQERPNTVIQQNTQINNNLTDNSQITPEEETALNREFSEFIRAKAKATPVLNPDNPTQTSG